MAVDCLDNLLAGCQDGRDVPVEDELELLDRLGAGRIADDDGERFSRHAKGQHDVLSRYRFGQQLDDGRRNGHVVEVEKGEAKRLGTGNHDFPRTGPSEPNEDVFEPGAGLSGDVPGFGELFGADDAVGEEDVGEVAGITEHDGGDSQVK